MTDQLYLFATLAGTRVAIATDEIEAVVKLTEIAPVPGMPSHVAGLSALRSRVLTIIDIAALIHGHATPTDQRRLAIIANISGHSYGLMVDGVSDIDAVDGGPQPLRGQIAPEWRPYARGLVDSDSGACLLVTLSSFVEAEAWPQAA